MTLPLSDGKLFFELMWKLQYYVNRKLGVHKDVSSIEEYAALPSKKKLKARDELWKNPKLIESYAQENPDALPADQLEVIQKWTGFIKGSFFIFRHLKTGSIFISRGDSVYSVQGLLDEIENLIPSHALPQMVEAVLLPFKGQIIYDGLLMGHNIQFGGGIRSNLNHEYTVAKQKDRIIRTLEPELAAPVIAKPKKNILPQLKEVSDALAKLKSDSLVQKYALAVARASIEAAIAEAEGNLSPDAANDQAHKFFKASKRFLDLLNNLAEE
jgi:hypothetical protein